GSKVNNGEFAHSAACQNERTRAIAEHLVRRVRGLGETGKSRSTPIARPQKGPSREKRQYLHACGVAPRSMRSCRSKSPGFERGCFRTTKFFGSCAENLAERIAEPGDQACGGKQRQRQERWRAGWTSSAESWRHN